MTFRSIPEATVINATRIQTAVQALSTAEAGLIERYPFHARFVATWRLQSTYEIPTMAVTIRAGRVHLLWNAEFVNECQPAELIGVLHHEINHLLFEHLFQPRQHYSDGRARIIAEEVTVNEWVSEPLPGEPITLRKFPQLPPEEDTATRYHRLARNITGGTGDVLDDFDIANDIDGVTLDDHSLWDEAAGMGEAGRAIVRLAIRLAWDGLTEVQRTNVPEALRQQIQRQWLSSGKCATEAIAVTGVGQSLDWKQVLRNHVLRGLDRRSTYSRSPRRFPERVGIIPGNDSRGDRGHVLAVIDTSGSIAVEMLQQIHRELLDIRGRHEVTIMECDSEIRRVYPLRGPLAQVLGRGATDLRPPFRDDVLRRSKPDLIVYFTDGQGPSPENPPAIPVLWCLTQNGIRPADWGSCGPNDVLNRKPNHVIVNQRPAKSDLGMMQCIQRIRHKSINRCGQNVSMSNNLQSKQKCDYLLQRWAESQDRQAFHSLYYELRETSRKWFGKHPRDQDDLHQELWTKVIGSPAQFMRSGKPGWSIRLLKTTAKNIHREKDRYLNREAHNYKRRQIDRIKKLCKVKDRKAHQILNGKPEWLGRQLTDHDTNRWIEDLREHGITADCMPCANAPSLFDIRIERVIDGHSSELFDEEHPVPQVAEITSDTSLRERIRSRLQPLDRTVLDRWLEHGEAKPRKPQLVAKMMGMTPNEVSKRLVVIRRLAADEAEKQGLWRKCYER